MSRTEIARLGLDKAVSRCFIGLMSTRVQDTDLERSPASGGLFIPALRVH